MDAVPMLVSLTDHGNQNVRLWSRATLSRMAHDDVKMAAGHPAIDERNLKPFVAPAE